MDYKNLRSLLKSKSKEPTLSSDFLKKEELAELKPKRLKEHQNFLRGINRSPADQEIQGNRKKREEAK